MTPPLWMVRAGRGSFLIDQFLDEGFVAVGFAQELGTSIIGKDRDTIYGLLKKANPTRKLVEQLVHRVTVLPGREVER